MSLTKKYICLISVLIVMAQNYESQISHVPNAQIALWTLHDWAGALINVGIAGLFAWKLFLVDPNSGSKPPPA